MMRINPVTIFLLALLSFDIQGQTRIFQGIVITEDLEYLPYVDIKINDAKTVGKTDTSGRFRVEVPEKTEKAIFSFVGFEPAIINLKNSCDTLEIIMMYSGTYDFISPKKVNKLMLKRFKRLPELHLLAFGKGIFVTKSACYEQDFHKWDPSKN